MDLELYMTAPNIQTTHAFTTRYGGVSRGAYATLNLGLATGDDPASVKENYAIVSRALGIPDASYIYPKQVHGPHVHVTAPPERRAPPSPPSCEADGLLTTDAGLALTVFTADCLPILLHDPVRGAIGAVHAGWRGTAADIAGAAIRKMAQEFGCAPADIRAAIGPGISKCCYETGPDVADALRKKMGGTAEACIEPRSEKYMIDLKEANRLLLLKAGLIDISVSDECTSCSNHKYWSHRKSKGPRGSQAAIIMLN